MGLEFNQVGWFEIAVEDLSRAVQYYEYVFGISLERQTMGHLEMALFPMKDDEQGAPGSLVRGEGYEPSTSGTLVYFSVKDIETVCHKSTEKGGRVIMEKFSIGEYGFVALLLDSEGNKLGIHCKE